MNTSLGMVSTNGSAGVGRPGRERGWGRRRRPATADAIAPAVMEPLETRALMSGWETTVDYQMAPGKYASFEDAASDAAGNLYVSGRAVDAAGVGHSIVRQRFAADGRWETILDVTGVPTFSQLAVSPAGAVYTATWNWKVFGRAAGQGAFAQVDSFAGEVKDLAIDAGGTVFGVGVTSTTARNKQTTNHWVVRRLAAGQAAFTTMEDFTNPGGTPGGAVANGVAVAPSSVPGAAPTVYVVGASGGSTYVQMVRKSTDGGVTWSTVDSYTFDPVAQQTTARAVTADAAGNVYVAGMAWETTPSRPKYGGESKCYWTVRQSRNAGGSWETVDKHQVASWGGAPADVGTDAAGAVYVVGTFTTNLSGGGTLYRSAVRSNAGGVWQTVDEYVVNDTSNKGARGTGFATDPAGNLYAVGSAYDSAGVGHAFIRSPAVTPPLTTSVVTTSMVTTSVVTTSVVTKTAPAAVATATFSTAPISTGTSNDQTSELAGLSSEDPLLILA